MKKMKEMKEMKKMKERRKEKGEKNLSLRANLKQVLKTYIVSF
jgi:hypothetical protein